MQFITKKKVENIDFVTPRKTRVLPILVTWRDILASRTSTPPHKKRLEHALNDFGHAVQSSKKGKTGKSTFSVFFSLVEFEVKYWPQSEGRSSCCFSRVLDRTAFGSNSRVKSLSCIWNGVEWRRDLGQECRTLEDQETDQELGGS